MKRIRCIWLLLLVLLLAGCGITQKEYNDAKEQAYKDGWDECLRYGNVGEFDEYRHDDFMEYVRDNYLDEFISENVDAIIQPLETNYPDVVIAAAARIMEEVPPDIPDTGPNYVANTNSKKFHLPDCSSVNDINAKNRKDWYGSREELIDEGYVPCKKCNP